MAGFAAGLVFGFSGYLTGYPPLQLGILRVAVWLPLILWLLLPDKSGKTHWSRWLMACAVHAVAFFANHPQNISISYLHRSRLDVNVGSLPAAAAPTGWQRRPARNRA